MSRLSFNLLPKFVHLWGYCKCVFLCVQNFAAQMAGGFDEKAGIASMGVMQGPMVRKTHTENIHMY